MKKAAAPHPYDVELADRLHSAAIHFLRSLRKVDGASGLSAPRLSALSVIVYAGSISLGELAAAEQVRPPSMSRLVDALEQDGLVMREASLKDGRTVGIKATERGKRLLQQGRSRRVMALASQLGTLAAGDRKTLEKALPILERLGRAPEAATDKD